MKPLPVFIVLILVAVVAYHVGYDNGTDDYYQLQVDYARRVQMNNVAPDVERVDWKIIGTSPVNNVEQCAVYGGKIIGATSDGEPVCKY